MMEKTKVKIAVIRKPSREECDNCYSYIEVENPIIEQVDTVEITIDEYSILRRHFADSKWTIAQIMESPEPFIELNLKKALAKQKKLEEQWEKRKEEEKRKAEERKKARSEKKRRLQIEEAKKLLQEAGEL